MHHVTPHLWFDTQAVEAAEFYVGLLPQSRMTHRSVLRDTPGGDCDIVEFELAGQPFMAISAGPLFQFNPAISFFLNFDPARDPAAREHLDQTWRKLAEGGTALMPLDAYPFSPRYGWIQDRYGLSWQLILSDPAGEPRPMVMPSLLFTGAVAGRAQEAIDLYCGVFQGSRRGQTARYPAGSAPDKPGTLMFGDFQVLNTWLAAMDSAHPHGFAFNEAVSLLIPCDTQREIDYYWERLAVDPDAGQCGWIKDRFGVSWQVHPTPLSRMLAQGTPEQVARVTQAFLAMKKFDIAALEREFAGEDCGDRASM